VSVALGFSLLFVLVSIPIEEAATYGLMQVH
jgi:hypothetical protein